MRKIVAVPGFAALLLIVPAAPALAEGAVIIDKDSGICYGQVPNRSGVLEGPILEGTLHVRSNDSWTTMTCHFDIPAELTPAKATHASGFTCHIGPYGSTTDTRASASSGGSLVMSCRINK